MKSSIYIHIPFCKKACHYCSFYFVVSPAQIKNYLLALAKELEARKNEHTDAIIDTIYFGGGTPTLLSIAEIEFILNSIRQHYTISSSVEVSLESNPENLTLDYIADLKNLGFNRLSIGVQSFFDDDLKSMNRAHTSEEASLAIQNAQRHFHNLSIDFIFGLPYSGLENWKKNLTKAIEFNIPHISTYNLTVEEKTFLARKLARKEVEIQSDETLNEMYLYTIEFLEKKNYINYEISNFGKKNYFSRHNLAYWSGANYLGFGPSAHSYDGNKRRWNVSNLKNYIENISNNIEYADSELLTKENKYNEFIMTRLRRNTGVPTQEIQLYFGDSFLQHFESSVKIYMEQNKIFKQNNSYVLTNSGKLIADHISSELML